MDRRAVSPPSERSFGLLFGGVAAAASAWRLWSGHVNGPIVLAVIAIVLVAVALTRPKLLARPNQLWFRFGLLLNSIVSPIVLGVIFFVLITPIGVFRRLTGKDALRLKRADGRTHWIVRPAAGPASSFKNQF